MEKGNGRRCACLNQMGFVVLRLLDSGERCFVWIRLSACARVHRAFCCIDAWCARDSVRSVRACAVRQVRSSASSAVRAWLCGAVRAGLGGSCGRAGAWERERGASVL